MPHLDRFLPQSSVLLGHAAPPRLLGGRLCFATSRGLPFEVRIPNAITLRTFAETDAGENIVPCENAQDMLARLGI